MISHFIGIDPKVTPPYKSTSLLLRRCFFVNKKSKSYILKTIGLGIADYYLNGTRITSGILLQAPSNYNKTLWQDTFDVTEFIREGKNVLSVELGNGFYNEGIVTTWHIENASWKNNKCLKLSLLEDNNEILVSDQKFKVKYSLFRTYNELRSGEKVNFNNHIEFTKIDFDDSSWDNAIILTSYPQGIVRDLNCPQIKEFEHLNPVNKFIKDNSVVFDFGYIFSGYVEINLNEKNNTCVEISYSEDIDENKDLNLHGLDCYHCGSDFQKEEIICNGEPISFKPSFSYFGFRYVEVKGIKNAKDFRIQGIVIHQDLKQKQVTIPKDRNIEKLYECVINSTLSNTYYMFTDCPTREKLGWLNDAQSSLEQIMYNFEAASLLKKWYQDIVDSIDEKGNVPGIAPSHNWGYEFGPLCGSIVGTLPYYFYKYYNDISLLSENIEKIEKYLDFVCKNEELFILGDWTGSKDQEFTPRIFTIKTYEYILQQIINIYKENKGEKVSILNLQIIGSEMLKIYNDSNTKNNSQTMMSVLLVLGIGNKNEIKDNLIANIENNHYKLSVGMFGNQFIYRALKNIERKDLIYKIVFNPNEKSFLNWINDGNKTLYETFGDTWSLSMNHHMYSNVIMELIK